MNCKNCQHPLKENAHFCENCGAKVVTDRIQFKKLILEFFILNFGVDSRFFLTLYRMTFQPDKVINEYLKGVRKRYINPFAFLAIGAGISLIVFNYFADDFILLQKSVNPEQMNELKEIAEKDISLVEGLSEKEIKKLEIDKKTAQFQLKFMDKMWEFMLRYYNLLTFIILFVYAVLSKWTFWKPHNYGEHLVMNSYIYGYTTYFTLIAFFSAMLIHPSIYIFTILGAIVYYMFAFTRIYKLSFGRIILKLLRFFIGLIFLFIVFAILSLLVGILIAYLGFINFDV